MNERAFFLRPSGDAPLAPVETRVTTVHGTKVRDDYSWLKATNWKEVLKDPATLPGEIRSHLERENAYTAAALAETEDLQKRLVAEMRARIKEDDASVPQPHGPFAYFTRYREGGQHPLIARQNRGGRRRDDHARRRQGSRRPRLFRSRRRRAFPRSQASRLERRHQGFGILHDPRARSCNRCGSRRRGRPHLRRHRLARRFVRLLLCRTRRQPSSRAPAAPSARRGLRRRRGHL